MKQNTKRIAFIYIPHIFIESEKLRRQWDEKLFCVVASGDSQYSIILDVCGNLARRRVRKGMFLKDIRYLRNNLNLMIADYEYMKETGNMIAEYLKGYSIIVEAGSFGEFYIDLSGTERLFGRALDTCLEIISHLNKEHGFNASAGIGSNKLISHLAAKLAVPGSAYEICAPAEAAFLNPAKIAHIPDVRPDVKADLAQSFNLHTIRDLLVFSESDLEAMFKREGRLLYSYSRNIAPDYLSEAGEGKVLARTLILSDEANDDALIRRRFFSLVLEMSSDMRRENIFPLNFNLKIIYKDNYRYVKTKKIASPTFVDRRLYAVLLPLLDDALTRRTCLKKIVLTFSGFIPAVIQESLFGGDDRELKLCRAFDAIRAKYGKKAIDYAG